MNDDAGCIEVAETVWNVRGVAVAVSRAGETTPWREQSARNRLKVAEAAAVSGTAGAAA